MPAGGRIPHCLSSAAILASVLTSACAPKLTPLPTGPGVPFAGHVEAFAQATERCRGVQTLVAVLSLSGRAGRTRLRGNVEAGFAEPGQARLEAPGPFGSRPLFILVAKADSATLVLPRDRRVLRDAPTEAIVEALAGVPLGGDELRAALAGCGLASGRVTGGRGFDGAWLAVEAGTVTQWLRQVEGAWRLEASVGQGLEVRYSEFAAGRPGTIRIRRAANAGAAAADLSIRLSQVDINVSLPPATFELVVPAEAEPITLEELRRAGPLGEGGP